MCIGTNCSWTNESYYYNTSGTCYIDYTKYMDNDTNDSCGQYYNASLTGWNNPTSNRKTGAIL